MVLEEVWKDIVFKDKGITYDYSGKYQVSSLGRVRSLIHSNPIIIKTFTQQDGYLRVNLYKNGKVNKFYIHRLVAFMFVINEKPDSYTIVNHMDENKQNNKASNLEWCDIKYNANYGTAQKRKAESQKHSRKKVICLNTLQIFDGAKEAKEWCGASSIKECCQGKCKTSGKHPETGEKLKWLYYEDYLKTQNEN